VVAASVLTPPPSPAPDDDATVAFAARPPEDTTGLPVPGENMTVAFAPPSAGAMPAPSSVSPGPPDDPDLTLPSMASGSSTTLSNLTPVPPRPHRPRNADDTGPLAVGGAFSARYHIIRVLGIGGMGAVYHAWDADLGVAVALKVIRPEATRDPATARELERRFKQELVLARQVTHKNVVRIHDMGEIDGIKYITMPYLDGEDLATTLRKAGKLDVPAALRIIRDVAAGLTAAHEAGIVHRDLKPANIMVLPDRAVIMDFGIARSASGPFTGTAVEGTPVAAAAPAVALPTAVTPPPGVSAMADPTVTVVGTILGTVQYMAPEQAKGLPADQRADVYALGLIFRDILLGKRRKSAAGDSPLDELKRRMEAAPPPARSVDHSIPDAVDSFISRCLDPDPAGRYQSSADVVAALDRLDPNGVPIPVKRVVRLPLVAAIVVMLLVATAGTLWYQQQFITEAEKAPISLIVADFQNGTTDPAFDNALAQTVRRGLDEASFITAIDRTRVRTMFGGAPPEPFDESAARQLAAKQGLPFVISGGIVPDGRGYTVSVKAVETVTGNVVVDDSEDASNSGQVIPAVLSLMAHVRRELGDETSESEQQFAMRSVSTSSLAVLGHYAAAVEAQSRGRFEDARQSYQQAVDLDPEFGLGYQGLAAMARNLGQPEEAEENIKKALRFVDKMTDREKLGTRGLYYRLSGDNQQCEQEYARLLERYKADSVAYNQRAICLAKLRRMAEATAALRQASTLLPNQTGYRLNLALMANLAGDFDAAEREFNSIRAIKAKMTPKAQVPDARDLQPLAYSQLGRGMLSEAETTYRTLAGMPDGASLAASGLGDLAMYRGRFAEAVRLFEDGAARDLADKSPNRAAIKFTSAAFAHLAAGRKSQAIAAADRALMLADSMSVRFLAGRVYVEAGAVVKATTQATWLADQLPAEPQAHGKILQGQIALATGLPRDAIRILQEANGILNTWFGHFDLGRAFLAAGAFQQAASEFDDTIKRRGEVLSLMDEGPTYGHLPAVYSYQGQVLDGLATAGFADAQAPLAAYRTYLDIRGSSQDDPLLPEIRRRITQ
jgi:serine/threonine protein kinase/tetratricopeptide (TPR) repeat protein